MIINLWHGRIGFFPMDDEFFIAFFGAVDFCRNHHATVRDREAAKRGRIDNQFMQRQADMQSRAREEIGIITFDSQAVIIDVDIFLDLRMNEVEKQRSVPIGIRHQVL
ncbi:hypothetical protein D3C80_1506170 [compost metagenome]